MSNTALITEALGSRNLELQNNIFYHEVLSAFIGNVEYMQNQLLIKMDGDRTRTDELKERLSLQQNLARSIKPEDAQSDSKTFTYFISYGGSTVPPFEGWKANTGTDVATIFGGLLAGVVVGGGLTAAEIVAKGGTLWTSPAGEKLSGKQLYAYYDQQAEATKSAMSALNAVTSQDNLSLQSLRSKVDSNTQLLSTIIKNEKDRKEGVMRNM
jgi:hypothetical protein